MYTDNALLFPHHVIATLAGLRGPEWRALVERILKYPENHEETLALILMMIRLNGCMSCETDSYRAMRGCTACTHQTLRRYKGSDEDLRGLFHKALEDVRAYAASNTQIEILANVQP